MKRIEEKVKDIVEVRPYGSLVDFRADPTQTVASYHFTDTTADLMSKWLNRAAAIAGNQGAAFALAGFRGVGKSHFLATLGIVLSNPELRMRLQDPVVEAATKLLQRRQYAVGYIRRGLSATLLDEVKEGLAPIIGVEASALTGSISEIMMQATMNTAGESVVLIIDTALERIARVARDDGATLTEIASIAKQIGIFVAIALDDDISSADGANSGIASEYLIDYLDQEHLYKIVDTKIFPKSARMLPSLHEIYQHYREVVPGFRWSEQRFTSLYPLHPSIMEIAPFVRLYLHEFALLGFASEAGARILGRPANSLIAPDEVFDNVEKGLRKVEELTDVFAAFDSLNATVVAKTPVMKRLQAKLVLKGLLLFSLNENGVSAAEIAASMLIFDENAPQHAVSEVESILHAFAAAMPDSIAVTLDSANLSRFGFRLSGKDNLRHALAESSAAIGDAEIRELLRRVMSERFSDCVFSDGEGGADVSTNSFVVWRGSNRPGLVHWGVRATLRETKAVDWEITIDTDALFNEIKANDDGHIYWRPSPLSSEELATLQRLAALSLDPKIRTEFKEHIAAATQAHTIAAEKALVRSFLIDGVLVIDGLEYNFSEEARTSQSLSQISTLMLESLFEGRYPMHPYFPQMLRMREVSLLVSDFFSGTQTSLDESQWLASTFAVQLDLAVKVGDKYVPSEAAVLNVSPLVQQIAAKLPQDGSKCDLEEVFNVVRQAPYGLVNEAAYLLLAGMASARLLEFVTNTGDRISRRSFDLKIIWDDIVGVALPVAAAYSSSRLAWWAGKITGKKVAGDLDSDDTRTAVTFGLAGWLTNWESLDLAGQFDSLGDSQLNSRFWRMSSISIRSFSIVADSIRLMNSSNITLDACLERIADAFSDSEAEILLRQDEIKAVTNYFSTNEIREAARLYLALCEYTGDPATDSLRVELDELLERSSGGDISISADELKIKLDLFRRSYCDLYTEEHDRAVRSRDLKDKVDEIRQTGIWREYQSVFDLSFFDPGYRTVIREISQRIGDLDCNFDAGGMAFESGACGCRFSLAGLDSFELWPNELWAAVNRGLSDFRDNLAARKNDILEAITDGIDLDDNELFEGVQSIRSNLTSDSRFGGLTDGEVRVFQIANDRIERKRRTISVQSVISSDAATMIDWDSTSSDIDEILASVGD